MKDRKGMTITFDPILDKWIGPEERAILEQCNKIEMEVDFHQKAEREEVYKARKC